MTGVAPPRHMGTAWRCQHRSRAVLKQSDWKSTQCRALTALWKSQLTDYLILFPDSLASCPLPRAFASSDEAGGEKDRSCSGPATCCAMPWLTAERAARTEAAVVAPKQKLSLSTTGTEGGAEAQPAWLLTHCSC